MNGNQVERLARLLERDATALAEMMAREIGKPVRFGVPEVLRTAECLRVIVRRFEATGLDEPAGPARLRRRPHGTVAVITPWNNPVYITLSKIVPALLYGNRVVWKPAPEALLVSRRVRQLVSEAGWSSESVVLVEGGRREAEEVMEDLHVRAVTITGSCAAGEAARLICSRRSIPLQAELGGNNAAVVWADADLVHAARLIAAGAFEMAGQRCTANRRAVVAENRRDDFLRLLTLETERLHWGDPLDPATQVGPLVSVAHRDRVASAVARAEAEGASVVVSHDRPSPGLAWYPPTIVLPDDPRHDIVQEETFGPVLVVQTARDWSHAMDLCNGVRQGLVAAVFTSSRAVAERFLDEAEAGILKVNQSTADAAIDVPFVGWKASGTGLPEHGVFDREFYTRPQAVYAPGLEELA